MRSNGEIRDDFVRQNGSWYERHKIPRIVLDGSETYIPMSAVDDNYMFYTSSLTIPIDNYSTAYLTNYFTTNTASSGSSTIGSYIYNQTLRIRVPSSVATTTEQFKAWLKEKYDEGNPVYVDYVLAEPTLLPCTNEQVEVLEEITTEPLYAEQTNFFSNDEVTPYLEVKYWKENI